MMAPWEVGQTRKIEVEFQDGSTESPHVVTRVSESLFRFESSSVFFDVSFHDVAEGIVAEDVLQIKSVVRRSGLEIKCWVIAQSIVEMSQVQELLGKLWSEGIMWQWDFGLLRLHLPPDRCNEVVAEVKATLASCK